MITDLRKNWKDEKKKDKITEKQYKNWDFIKNAWWCIVLINFDTIDILNTGNIGGEMTGLTISSDSQRCYYQSLHVSGRTSFILKKSKLKLPVILQKASISAWQFWQWRWNSKFSPFFFLFVAFSSKTWEDIKRKHGKMANKINNYCNMKYLEFANFLQVQIWRDATCVYV